MVDPTGSGIGISFATADPTAGAAIRPLNSNEYAPITTTGTNNVLLTSATTTNVATQTVNSLTFDNNATLQLNGLLSNSSGGILVRNNTTSSISGGVINQTLALSPLDIWTVGNLTINSTLNGGNGVNGTDSQPGQGGGGHADPECPGQLRPSHDQQRHDDGHDGRQPGHA